MCTSEAPPRDKAVPDLLKIHSRAYPCFYPAEKRERCLFLLAAAGETSARCTLKCVKCGEATGTTRCCLSTSRPAEKRFSSPITQRAETPLAAAEPKDISSVHFKGALDYVRAQSILRGSFEGKLAAEPLVATLC